MLRHDWRRVADQIGRGLRCDGEIHCAIQIKVGNRVTKPISRAYDKRYWAWSPVDQSRRWVARAVNAQVRDGVQALTMDEISRALYGEQ